MKVNRQRLKNLGILILVGLAYYLETQTLGFTLGCPLFQLTGLRCPGCGLTRACLLFMQGELAGAAAANWGLTLCLPLALPWLCVFVYRWLFNRPTMTRGMKVTGVILVIWLVLWGIVRNLVGL